MADAETMSAQPFAALHSPTPGSLRRLLASLRDVMAGSGAAQHKLDKIVHLIAAELRADVCSTYVMRAGEVLELFATKGLNPTAVHRTRMRVGEGLVGLIAAQARPVALANAPQHPNFAYKPETGEDPYQSLAGVPLVRGGRVRGVLVIQHTARRDYHEEEVETLQTLAMVVAELVAAGELVSSHEIGHGSEEALLPFRLVGSAFNRGVARGLAVLHRPLPTLRQTVAEDPDRELARLEEAIASLHVSIDALVELSHAVGHGEHRDILETYRMFASDRGWLTRLREAVRNGLTAEAAVVKVQNDTRARLASSTDAFFRDRLHDLDDLTRRLQQHLAGKPTEAAGATLPDDVILVARTLGPADLLDYDRSRLRGLVLEEGSGASHVAIVARAFGLPVVGQVPNATTRIDPLDPVIVDGDHGSVLVRPGEDVQQAIDETLRARVAQQRDYAAQRHLPAITRDGVAVSLHLNCGLLIDLPDLELTGADGIGLLRTEIAFMMRSEFPNVEAQAGFYGKVLDAAADRPVLFRTLDIGADKRLPYLPLPYEENPALGWRAIRIGLDRPMFLRRQLRALLRAAQGRRLHVMFPMIAEVEELDDARRILDLEVTRAVRDAQPLPDDIAVGVMLEVPALVHQLDMLLPRVRFVSIGSNDLVQYLFASDRGDPMLGNRYDPVSPAMLTLVRDVAGRCRSAGVSLSVCGEMAGRPVDALALVAMGVRQLSMAAPSVGAVKSALRHADIGALGDFLGQRLRRPGRGLRRELDAFARDHGIPV